MFFFFFDLERAGCWSFVKTHESSWYSNHSIQVHKAKEHSTSPYPHAYGTHVKNDGLCRVCWICFGGREENRKAIDVYKLLKMAKSGALRNAESYKLMQSDCPHRPLMCSAIYRIWGVGVYAGGGGTHGPITKVNKICDSKVGLRFNQIQAIYQKRTPQSTILIHTACRLLIDRKIQHVSVVLKSRSQKRVPT